MIPSVCASCSSRGQYAVISVTSTCPLPARALGRARWSRGQAVTATGIGVNSRSASVNVDRSDELEAGLWRASSWITVGSRRLPFVLAAEWSVSLESLDVAYGSNRREGHRQQSGRCDAPRRAPTARARGRPQSERRGTACAARATASQPDLTGPTPDTSFRRHSRSLVQRTEMPDLRSDWARLIELPWLPGDAKLPSSSPPEERRAPHGPTCICLRCRSARWRVAACRDVSSEFQLF